MHFCCVRSEHSKDNRSKKYPENAKTLFVFVALRFRLAVFSRSLVEPLSLAFIAVGKKAKPAKKVAPAKAAATTSPLTVRKRMQLQDEMMGGPVRDTRTFWIVRVVSFCFKTPLPFVSLFESNNGIFFCFVLFYFLKKVPDGVPVESSAATRKRRRST